ncbi:hypothetical protein ACROYT_G040293 [Oculina patagonica]
MKYSYCITLKEDAKPFQATVPRNVLFPLCQKTKEQLDQMLETGVVSKVDQPTNWCAPMVVILKSNGKIQYQLWFREITEEYESDPPGIRWCGVQHRWCFSPCQEMPPTDAGFHETKQKAGKRKSRAAAKKPGSSRWKWSNEMVDKLIECVYEYKVKKDFECKDMESDLIQFYSDIRLMMSKLYPPDDFGPPESVSLPETGVGMDVDEFRALKARHETDAKQIKVGYDRVKEKIKVVRQKYRTSVNENTRSGSGRIITTNWDTLTKIWGGSPAVSKIPNAITSATVETDHEDAESDEMEETETSGAPGMGSRSVSPSLSTEDGDIDSASGSQKRKLSTHKFVDNKRRKLEKNLSANQREQVLVGVARDELAVKEAAVKELAASTKVMEESMKTIASSIQSLGSSLGTGLALLANALATSANSQSTVPQLAMQDYDGRLQRSATPPPLRSFSPHTVHSSMLNDWDGQSHYTF